jgi:hypothetical protein
MRKVAEVAAEFLARKRIAVTGVSRTRTRSTAAAR